MQIQGTVFAVEQDIQINKVNGGSYTGTRLTYRDVAGALKEQNFTQQTLKFNPTIKVALSNLTAGESFVMTKEKEGEFWNVKSIVTGGIQPTASSHPTTASTKATPAPKSTYETPEERAKKQVYIVRQSSITAAINMLGSKAKSAADVIELAKQFEGFVFDTGTTITDSPDFTDLSSDEID